MTFRLSSAWLMSLLATVFLHENCFGGWKLFWLVCKEGSPEHEASCPATSHIRSVENNKLILSGLMTNILNKSEDYGFLEFFSLGSLGMLPSTGKHC